MDLTIVDASRNTSEQVTVPASVATERIVGRLIQIWQLPVMDRDGRVLDYWLERAGSPIHPNVTLADADVSENDVLRLIASPTDAPPRGHQPLVPSSSFRRAADPPPPVRTRQGVSGRVLLALVVLLPCVAVGVALAGGAFSSSRKKSAPALPSASTPLKSPAQQAAQSGSEQARDREAIMRLLDSYQRAYSNHEVEGLEQLFTRDVRRHGLAKGGCRISEGVSSVLASYQSQFEAGSGNYRLVGLSARQVQIDRGTLAHLKGHYKITPGGSGYVDFKFSDGGGGWKINEINALCH